MTAWKDQCRGMSNNLQEEKFGLRSRELVESVTMQRRDLSTKSFLITALPFVQASSLPINTLTKYQANLSNSNASYKPPDHGPPPLPI